MDIGPLLITDWSHKNAFSLFYLELEGNPPVPDSYLMQGKGIYCSPSNVCTGSRHVVEFQYGKTYKLSIVNSGTSSQYTFWIDGHTFQVVGTDFVPINPYVTDTLNIAIGTWYSAHCLSFLKLCIGQRYDIIVTANATFEHGTNFWMHARSCSNETIASTLGIIRYDPASTADPYTPPGNRVGYGCLDPAVGDLVPVVPMQVGVAVNDLSPAEYLNVSMRYYPNITQESPLKRWVIKGSSMYVNWSEPSLKLLTDYDATEASFPQDLVPIFLDYPEMSWVYFLIEGNFTPTASNIFPEPVAHPIHLHGHDFVILDQSSIPFDAATFNPNLNNPPRRDTAMLPKGGYLVIGFQMNNPGTWLMHCHIAWHASSGMAVQFIESPRVLHNMVEASGIVPEMNNQCDTWTHKYNTVNIPAQAVQGDESGI